MKDIIRDVKKPGPFEECGDSFMFLPWKA